MSQEQAGGADDAGKPAAYDPDRPNGLGLADPERENALLVGIIEAISTGPALGPLTASVARLIVEATATDVCFVHVLDDGGGALTLTGATPPFDCQVGRIKLPVGEGVSGWVASHRKPAVITMGKETDPRYRYFPELAGRDYTSMVSVPMESALTGLVGVLNVHTREWRDFTDRDVRLLASIGSLVAGAVHQARLHRQLAAREQAAERFAEQVIAAQEAERRRLAGDIHDGITQRLVSIAYHLDAADDAVRRDADLADRELRRARELTDLTLEEAHAAIAGLRPPVLDDLGLAEGLASLARSIGQMPVNIVADRCRLPEHVEIALYRIAQEALQNIVKHAQASTASVELHCAEDRVQLRITDDGCGFEVEPRAGDSASYGLTSMTERAELIGGRLTITSRPGIGTTVTATVPITRPSRHPDEPESGAGAGAGTAPAASAPAASALTSPLPECGHRASARARERAGTRTIPRAYAGILGGHCPERQAQAARPGDISRYMRTARGGRPGLGCLCAHFGAIIAPKDGHRGVSLASRRGNAT